MRRHWAGQLHDYFYIILSRPETHNFGTWTYTANEKKPLLSYVDTEMETIETDDPITRVTKYQTHLIMLADKLATTPDSAKTAAQTDSLARATAALLQGLASTEAKEDTKARLLGAARGLTDSVAGLLADCDRSAAHPGDEASRVAAGGAAQRVRTEAAEAVLLVTTLLLLKQLEEAARAAVTAAAASVKIAREASNDNDDLAEHVAGLDVVAKVLEEKIENFSAKPSAADTQSYLIIGSKRFLEPSNK